MKILSRGEKMTLLSFGKLFSITFTNYKKHIKLFTKIALLLVFVPNVIFGILSTYHSINLTFDITKDNIISWVGNGVTSLSSLLFTVVVIKVLTEKRKKDQNMSVIQSLTKGMKHFFKAILVQIIFMLTIGIPIFPVYFLKLTDVMLSLLYLLTWFIYALIVTVYFTFVYYALITDNCGVIESFKHSLNVVRGRWWRVLGFLLLVGLIIIGMFLALMIPLSLILGVLMVAVNSAYMILTISIFTVILVSILQMFATPFTLTFMEEFYLDLKKNTKSLK